MLVCRRQPWTMRQVRADGAGILLLPRAAEFCLQFGDRLQAHQVFARRYEEARSRRGEGLCSTASPGPRRQSGSCEIMTLSRELCARAGLLRRSKRAMVVPSQSSGRWTLLLMPRYLGPKPGELPYRSCPSIGWRQNEEMLPLAEDRVS